MNNTTTEKTKYFLKIKQIEEDFLGKREKIVQGVWYLTDEQIGKIGGEILMIQKL